MAKEEKALPMTQAGLVRYYSIEHSKIKLSPEHVIIFTIVVSLLVILLKFMG